MIRLSLLAGVLLAACAPEGRTPQETGAPAASAPAQGSGVALLGPDEIPAPAGEIALASPVSGAKVTSPLTVEGAVSNTWMFEGVLPAELAVNGEVIAQAPGQQQAPDNWTRPGPVRFRATLSFDVREETDAVLILREDAPRPVSADSDVAGPARTLRIPIVLLPPQK